MNGKKDHLIILAGGKGTRMNEVLPKALLEIKGKALLEHITGTLAGLDIEISIVVGYEGKKIIEKMGSGFNYVWQPRQLGTGDAVLCAKKELSGKTIGTLIVLPSDHPLIRKETVERLLNEHKNKKAHLSLATVVVPHFEDDNRNFYNCGRIMRDKKGEIAEIVELKDASEKQRETKELNVSYYCFDAGWLWKNIDGLKKNNAAKEYYLTDLVKIAKDRGDVISSVIIENPKEGLGVNTKEQFDIVKKHI